MGWLCVYHQSRATARDDAHLHRSLLASHLYCLFVILYYGHVNGNAGFASFRFVFFFEKLTNNKQKGAFCRISSSAIVRAYGLAYCVCIVATLHRIGLGSNIYHS